MNIKFAVLSREKVANFDYEKPYILISIVAPGDEECYLMYSDTRLNVLRMKFHDINNKDKEYFSEISSMVFFTKEHAREIIDFVNKYIDRIDLIAVNCDGGISRSAGVVAGLSKCLTGEDSEFFKHYMPNSLVYSTIINEWYKKEEK